MVCMLCLKTTGICADIKTRVAMNGSIYHERQVKELCALHALNNLFQEKDAFSKTELDSICYSLSPNVWINPHKSLLGLGNYDINVIMAALQRKDCETIWFDKRKDPRCLNLSQIMGFILNVPSDYKLGFVSLPLRRRHWIAIRQIDSIYYNLDSKLDSPQVIGQGESVVSYLLEQLDCKADKELFVVVTREVDTNHSWQLAVANNCHNDRTEKFPAESTDSCHPATDCCVDKLLASCSCHDAAGDCLCQVKRGPNDLRIYHLTKCNVQPKQKCHHEDHEGNPAEVGNKQDTLEEDTEWKKMYLLQFKVKVRQMLRSLDYDGINDIEFIENNGPMLMNMTTGEIVTRVGGARCPSENRNVPLTISGNQESLPRVVRSVDKAKGIGKSIRGSRLKKRMVASQDPAGKGMEKDQDNTLCKENAGNSCRNGQNKRFGRRTSNNNLEQKREEVKRISKRKNWDDEYAYDNELDEPDTRIHQNRERAANVACLLRAWGVTTVVTWVLHIVL